MSGVFARMFPTPVDDAVRAEALLLHRTLAIRLAGDRLEEHDDGQTVGAVVHHGLLRSGGLARSPAGSVALLCGSCWLADDDGHLASPKQVLEHLQRAQLDAPPSLQGNYALVLIDPARGRLVAECDPFGVHPLYYGIGSRGVVVASEIKHVLQAVAPRLDSEAVGEMMAFGYIASDLTLVEGVKRLPPGARLVVENQRASVDVPRRSSFPRDRRIDDALLDELSVSFERAISRYRDDTSVLCASLSGGLDSRIACLAAQRVGFDVRAWSTGEPQSLECRIAKEFSRKNGIPIEVHEINGARLAGWFGDAVWVTEGRCPPGHLHFLDGMMTGHYLPGVQLHGLIGDAVIGGDFDLTRPAFDTRAATREDCRRRMGSFLYWPVGRFAATVPRALEQSHENARDRVLTLLWDRCPGEDAYSDYLWFRYQFRVLGFTVPCLCSQVLPWTDLVVPYVDPAFFALSGTIDSGDVLDRRCQIEWARRRYPGVGSVPRVKDGVLVSLSNPDPAAYARGYRRLTRIDQVRYILCRLSAGRLNLPQRETYPFYAQWFRRWPVVRKFVETTLLSPESLDRGLWKADGIRRLMADLRIGRNVWDVVGTILTIEIFARLFVDSKPRPSGFLRPPAS